MILAKVRSKYLYNMYHLIYSFIFIADALFAERSFNLHFTQYHFSI